MGDNKPQDFERDIRNVMGFYNHRGRLIEKTKEGFIMAGIKFPNLHELNKAIDISLSKLGENINVKK